jgi:hypothetical protein
MYCTQEIFIKIMFNIRPTILIHSAVAWSSYVHVRYAVDRASGFKWGKMASLLFCKGEIKLGTG